MSLISKADKLVSKVPSRTFNNSLRNGNIHLSFSLISIGIEMSVTNFVFFEDIEIIPTEC